MSYDPYLSSVIALVHFDGTDGGTSFTDSSSSAQTVTSVGSPALTSANARFGPTSVQLGTSKYVQIASHANLALPADFTIELWARQDSSASGGNIFTFAGQNWNLSRASSGGNLQFWNGSATTNYSASEVPTVSFVHYAIARQGASVRIFANGNLLGTYTDTGVTSLTAADINLGWYRSGSSSYWSGQIDEFRLTKGVARYTANFTPPSDAFSSYAGLIGGNVKDSGGANAARKVRAYREDTGALVGETTSDGSTGNYSMPTEYDGAHTLVLYPGALETTLNCLVLRGVMTA